ncbi:Uncharacterized protein CTA1_13140 [Colletotrichum tanaceti]|uniref:DUF1748-domain-containing protein n=5 Tax=Colletotrichum TaxID=5455 RepID=A0A4U6XLZ4_9PEZI|nr:Uncharacterized protein CTA1_13140 [Colletotrichum tanaceti]
MTIPNRLSDPSLLRDRLSLRSCRTFEPLIDKQHSLAGINPEKKKDRTNRFRSTSTMIGRLTHYAFDAVLFSAFLAGMKRSTGLTPSFKTDRAAGENKDVSKWIDKYLGVGEWVMDQSVAIAGSSGWFERTR